MTTDTPLIEVTDLAARKLGEVLAEHDKPGNMLRVMVMPGPGGALQYMLGVEESARDDDVVIETDSVSMLVDADSAPLIDGASIDYVEGLMRSGFVISNPNAPVGGCACGGGGGRRLRRRRRRCGRPWRRGRLRRGWRRLRLRRGLEGLFFP